MLVLYGVTLGRGQFRATDPVITFETGSTDLPSISGVRFSDADGDASFYSQNDPYFGRQYFGNFNGSTYLNIYFDQPQQAIGAYLISDDWSVVGVTTILYDQSNNVIESASVMGLNPNSAPVFLGIGEPTAQIYRVEWQYIGSGYFGVDNVVYGSAIGLSQMPNIPTGLRALSQGTTVALNWSPADRATTYNVKRGNTSGGPYTTVGSGVMGTNYTDTTITNGIMYFYVVTAVNAFGESAASQQAVGFAVDRFAFEPIVSPQTTWIPFAVTISACDSNGVTLTNFTGAAILCAAGDRGEIPLIPAATTAFLNGQWTGMVTLEADFPIPTSASAQVRTRSPA